MRRIGMALVVLGFLTSTCHLSAQTSRSEADLKRDETSKPVAVLEFMGVQAGWKVLDMFAGSGYYSEVLSSAVGETGKVYLHNNQAYMAGVKNLDERLRDDRLPNVEVYVREVEDINLPSNSLDMAILVMAYHDAYFEQSGWTVTADPLFATLRRTLKPGGTLAIIDHHGIAGSGKLHAQALHRIDAEFAREDISSRGFKYVDSTDILENPQDDLSVSVFDPAIRGHTSRFVYKFIKQ
jgi:predicted methyltransferase